MIRTLGHHRTFLASVMLSAGLASIALMGGLGIQAMRDELLSFTPLLIALPAMNAMTGDYATLIAAHVGDPEMYRQRLRKLMLSLLISVPISLVSVTAMSLFVASLQGFTITTSVLVQYIAMIAVALISILGLTILSIFVINKILKNREINSDDVLIPMANTIASVLVLGSFALMALNIT